MEYALMKYRNLQPNSDMSSMTFLFSYGSYKKDREDVKNQTPNNVTRAY